MTRFAIARWSRQILLPGVAMMILVSAAWLSASIWWRRYPADAFGVSGTALRIRERTVDGGRVRIGQPVRCTFHLHNVSGSPRKILDVRPGCSCTTVTSVSREIAPGSWGEVTVEIETTKKTGPRSSSVLIETDDPERPRINTLVTCSVLPAVALTPERLLFQADASGEFPSQFVRISSLYEGEALRLRAVQPSDPRIKISLQAPADGRDSGFRVSVDSMIPDGTTLASAVIQIDGSVQKSLRIPITIRHRRKLISEPEVLKLPANSRQAQQAEFTVRTTSEALLEVGQVNLPENQIRFHLEPLEEHAVRIRLSDLKVTNAWNSRHLEVSTSQGLLRVPIIVSSATASLSGADAH